MKKTIVLIAGLILVSSIFAQPGPRHEARNDCRPDRMMMEMRERGENRDAMMAFKFTEELELTSEQADVFFPRFREHRDEMEAIGKELRDSKDELRKKIEDEKEISDSDLQKVLNKVNSLHAKRDHARFTFIKGLDDILDNTQIAKLAMVPNEFQHRKMMKQVKRPQNRR